MRSASSGLRHPASASCLGRHSRLAGRCPNNSSLFPPLAAVVVVAAEKLFYDFGIPERLRTLRYSIFTGGVGTNSLSQSLTALPAPSRREPLARPGTLHFRRKLSRHAKGPISEDDFPRPGEDVTAGDKKGNLSSAARLGEFLPAWFPRCALARERVKKWVRSARRRF